ncbi:MAG: helix-turn-helix domain-containing protein [Candidatus Sericytochromatia bacterium]|nr:helix-turn-helix domain-containing protein [Candidatus Sericytochromatia bacterium]
MCSWSSEDVYSGENVLHTGQLVRALHGDRGIGRVDSASSTHADVSYFLGVGRDIICNHALRFLVRVRLIPGTLCFTPSEPGKPLTVGWVRRCLGDSYELALPDGALLTVPEAHIRIYAQHAEADPVTLLQCLGHGNPLAADRRRNLVAAMTQWRASSRGLTGWLSSRLPLSAQGFSLIARALTQNKLRCVLADPDSQARDSALVGLVRQLFAEQPRARCLVIAAGERHGWWEHQLADHIRHSPIRRLMTLTPDETEICESPQAPHMMVIEGAAPLVEGAWLAGAQRRRFDKLRALSQQCEHLILLADTPVQGPLDIQFALLHLIDPHEYPLEKKADWLASRDPDEAIGRPGERLISDRASCLRARRLVFPVEPTFLQPLESPHQAVCEILGHWRETAYQASENDEESQEKYAAIWTAFHNAWGASPEALKEVVSLRHRVVGPLIEIPGPANLTIPRNDFQALTETPLFAGELQHLEALSSELALGREPHPTQGEAAAQIVSATAKGKVLAVTMYGRLAHELFQRCAADLGADTIALVTTEASEAERTREIDRFNHDASCLVLMADEALFDGDRKVRADVVVHVDTPWQFSTWAKRLQRLDAEDPAAAEHVIRVPDISHSGDPGLWQAALKEAFWSDEPRSLHAMGVWRSLDTTHGLNAFLRGPKAPSTIQDDLQRAQSTLQKLQDAEEQRDPAVKLTSRDYADFQALAKQDAACVVWQAALEGWMYDVLRLPLPSPGHPSERTEDIPSGLWKRLGPLLTTEHEFSRVDALRNPHKAFLRPGTPLVDTILSTLSWNARGQCAAVWREAKDWPTGAGSTWTGLRLDWVIEADETQWHDLTAITQDEAPSAACVKRQADALCPPRHLTQFIDLAGQEVTDPQTLSVLNLPYSEVPGGHRDWPLVRELLPVLQTHVPGEILQEGLSAAVAQAQEKLRTQTAVMEFFVRQEGDSAAHPAGASPLPSKRADEAPTESHAALHSAIRAPRVRLDTLTLFIISGEAPPDSEHHKQRRGPRHAHPMRLEFPASEGAIDLPSAREARGLTARELATLASVPTERLNALETRGVSLDVDAMRRVSATLEALPELNAVDTRGPAIAARREQRGQTLAEGACELGITPEALARIEAEGAPPEMARRLARALHFSTDQLASLAPFLGRRLTSLRRAAALSQAQVAERLEVPTGVVAALELGRVTPSDALLAKLRALLPIPEAMKGELVRLRPRALDLGDPDADLNPPMPAAAFDTHATEAEASGAPPPRSDDPATVATPTREADLPLRSLRQRKGLSQKELADMLGMSTALLSFCERGTKQLPAEKARTAACILAALADVPSSEFVGPRLREKMERQGWDAPQLAQQSGVSLSTIQASLEIGFDNAAREDVRRLFNALGNRRALWTRTEIGWHGPSDEDLEALGVPAPLFAALRAGTMIPDESLYVRLLAVNASAGSPITSADRQP